MKKRLIYFLLVAILLAFLTFLKDQNSSGPAPQGPPPPPTHTPWPKVTQPEEASSVPQAPNAAKPQSAGPAEQGTAISSRIQELARQARVEIVRYERIGASGILEVRWISDVVTEGTDFADSLRQAGIIRMFEPDGTPLRASTTPDGRRAFTSRFKLVF